MYMMAKDVKPGYTVKHVMPNPATNQPEIEKVGRVFVTREAVYIDSNVYFPNTLLNIISTK